MVKQANDESLSGFDVVIRSRPRGREKTWAALFGVAVSLFAYALYHLAIRVD